MLDCSRAVRCGHEKLARQARSYRLCAYSRNRIFGVLACRIYDLSAGKAREQARSYRCWGLSA